MDKFEQLKTIDDLVGSIGFEAGNLKCEIQTADHDLGEQTEASFSAQFFQDISNIKNMLIQLEIITKEFNK